MKERYASSSGLLLHTLWCRSSQRRRIILSESKSTNGNKFYISMPNKHKKITSNDKKNNPQPKNLCVFSISSFFSVFTL